MLAQEVNASRSKSSLDSLQSRWAKFRAGLRPKMPNIQQQQQQLHRSVDAAAFDRLETWRTEATLREAGELEPEQLSRLNECKQETSQYCSALITALQAQVQDAGVEAGGGEAPPAADLPLEEGAAALTEGELAELRAGICSLRDLNGKLMAIAEFLKPAQAWWSLWWLSAAVWWVLGLGWPDRLHAYLPTSRIMVVLMWWLTGIVSIQAILGSLDRSEVWGYSVFCVLGWAWLIGTINEDDNRKRAEHVSELELLLQNAEGLRPAFRFRPALMGVLDAAEANTQGVLAAAKHGLQAAEHGMQNMRLF